MKPCAALPNPRLQSSQASMHSRCDLENVAAVGSMPEVRAQTVESRRLQRPRLRLYTGETAPPHT